jgi:putative flippase GtrA
MPDRCAIGSRDARTLMPDRRKSELSLLLRYLAIGASAAALDLALFVISFEVFGWNEAASQTLSVGCAVIWSFALNARFNFGVNDRLLLRFVSFCAVAVVGYLVGLGIILGLRDGFDVRPTFGKVVGMPVVFVAQYLLNSRISFRSRNADVIA